jgi:hypothetical protein
METASMRLAGKVLANTRKIYTRKLCKSKKGKGKVHPRHPYNRKTATKKIELPPIRAEGFTPKARTLVNTSLADAVRARRGDLSIRKAAAEIGEPHTAIQFVEAGRLPRPKVFLKLLWWMNVITPEEFKRLEPYTE